MNGVMVQDSNFHKWWFRLENSILKLLLRAGLKLGKTYLLSVKGRKSGALRSTPVLVVDAAGARYVVAPYGPVNWVRNARSAGSVILSRGAHAEVLRAEEVGPEESAPVLKKYVAIAPATRSCFHAGPQSPLQEFVAEAPRHPVFRLVA